MPLLTFWPATVALLQLHFQFTAESGTTLGKLFVASVPKMNKVWDSYYNMPQIYFYIFTNSPKAIQVNLQIMWHQNNPPRTVLTVFTTRAAVYKLHKDYEYLEGTGIKWTYVFSSNKDFGVCILMQDSKISADTVTLIPVSGWGRIYYAFTSSYTPSIQIITFEGPNHVYITLRVGQPNKFKMQFKDKTYTNGQDVVVVLERAQAFEISECKDRNEMGSLTGTRILGELPIGVVSGACKAYVPSMFCDTGVEFFDTSRADVWADMLLPRESYGKDFILFHILSRVTPGYYVAIAGHDETTLSIYADNGEGDDIDEVIITRMGDYKELNYANTVGRLVSDKAIQLIYLQRSACRFQSNGSTGENGDPSMSIVVPTELFFYYYDWATPSDMAHIEHYALILIFKVYRNQVLFDDNDLQYIRTKWSEIVGLVRWEMGELSVRAGSHILRLRNNFYFGCYIYGLGWEYSYMHPGGMITAELDPASCIRKQRNVIPGDLIDNDCDGKIDEEKEDSVDNDQDGLIDEDLNVFEDESVLRERERKKSTSARTTTTKRTTQRITELATMRPQNKVCPEFRFGYNCERSCANCIKDCNKETGTCRYCKFGFKDPSGGCQVACTTNEYGDHCTGNCNSKCKRDCYERVYGNCESCPKGKWGKDCVWDCSNCLDYCDNSYGRCTDCKSGYKRPDIGCSVACGENEYGHLCQGNCHDKCRHDCFERVFGECKECPLTRWGPECSETCPHCYDDCNKSTGACSDCRPGYTNPLGGCHTPCSQFTFGYKCELTCPNCASDCNKETGACTNCRPGFVDPDTGCNKLCPATTWGYKCSLSCANCIGGCNATTGICQDCQPGYKNPMAGCDKQCERNEYGPNCLSNCQVKCGKDCAERVFGECEVCPVGQWGLHCLQSCEHCKEDCHKSFGFCPGCVAGYKGAHKGCLDVCEQNEYGENCEGICNEKCNGSDCYERIFGECQKCPDFRWGLRCEERCLNCMDPCNTSTGACSSCKAGFKGKENGCNIACGSNEFGENCAHKCQEKCGKDCYERRFGLCNKCPKGKWGLDCLDSCENCKEECDNSYGTCNHCKAGFKRPDMGCAVPCGVNEYGEDCIGNCTKKCGKDCFERQHGICTGNQFGAWLDWECSRDCTDRRQHRRRFCKFSAECHQENQTRESNCYVGKKCPSDCPPFSWGPDCKQSCIKCAKDCDKFTGSCTECKRGYKYPSQWCKATCEQYEYGTDCAGDCKKKCKDTDCFERINGTCIVHGKFSMWGPWRCVRDCQSNEEKRYRYCNEPEPANGGRDCTGEKVNSRTTTCNKGIKCPEDCLNYEWGINCLHTCQKCMTPCDKLNGSCASCKAGFKGAKHGCQFECELFEYGINCAGDCRIKCLGQDCLNRIVGECKTNYLKYIPLVFSLLLLPICTYWCLGPKNIQLNFEEAELVLERESSFQDRSSNITGGIEKISDVDEGTSVVTGGVDKVSDPNGATSPEISRSET